MALFDKLFSLKRRLDADNFIKGRNRSHQINPEQVRLLLFKECDWRGRRLLFDSSSIQKVPAGKHDKSNGRQVEPPCIVEVSNGFSYMYKGPAEDTTVLGEMIFGAVAINYKSVSLKIHIMDEPRRLMFTKVFCVPTQRSRAERRTSDRTDGSSFMNNSSILRNESRPLNMPSFTEDGVALSFSMDRGDSGYCGERSSHSSVGSTYDYFTMFDAWDGGGGGGSQEDFYSFHSLPGRKLSTSSNGSWQRRTFQNITTRFELGTSSHRLDVPPCDSQIFSNSSASNTSDSIASGSLLPPRKTKLGLAVLISVADAAQLDLVRKCMEHSPQLQALVCRLRLATLSAGAGAAFVSTLHRASEDAARWLSDLLYGPRLQPMWLAMVTGEARTSNKLADTLLSDLCSVLAVGDTKTTNFFISTLLTHVLTYHLGWVTTVSPYESNDHRPSPTRRPYNALWAQLTDLCGSIGFPPRAARTIISGEKNTQFVNRLLSILTFFLRCGDVKKTEFRYKECAIKTISVKTISPNRTRDTSCDVAVSIDTQNSDSVSTLVASDVSLKKTATLADLRRQLSSSPECASSSAGLSPTCALKRNSTTMHSSLKASSDSSLNSILSNDSVQEQKVVFVLGDDEKLVGLKNKSANGKSVKKSSKVQTEPTESQDAHKRETCEVRSTESPSKCCGQTLQHSKPIKHSGFKFEFDKYPQIVTNYMKSKNLEILDRHYIGKPGNLKLDHFQFDPMIVPPIQEEKCDACEKCQLMESMLQTPTNASEMEYMNDLPRISEPQHAKEITVTDENRNHRELSPKTFVRRKKENVVVVNSNNNVSNLKVMCTLDDKANVNETDPTLADSSLTVAHVSVLPQIPKISIEDFTMASTDTQFNTESMPLQRTKLKFIKSTNNLNSLFSQDLDDLSITNDLKLDYNRFNVDSLNIDLVKDNISISKFTSDISNNNETKSKPQKSSDDVKVLLPLSIKDTEPHKLEERKVSQESEKITEVNLLEQCECKLRSCYESDGRLLSLSSDHNVPDLILQNDVCEKCKESKFEIRMHAKENITAGENKDQRLLSQEIIIKRRKVKNMVANINNTNASNVNISSQDKTDTPLANNTVIATQSQKISIQGDAMYSTDTQINTGSKSLQRTKLKFTKSTNNLSLLSQDLNELDTANKPNDDSLSITSEDKSSLKFEELNTQKIASKCMSEISNNEANENLASKEIKLTIPSQMPIEQCKPEPRRSRESDRDRLIEVKTVTELSLPELCEVDSKKQSSGFDRTLLGGLSDRYVPDLILQGTIEKPSVWERELRRDLDVTSYLNKQEDAMPVQAVAIIGDTNTWEVRVVGRECGTGGMSSLVGAMLDAVPTMWNAKVPAHQCISFLEHKLREFCVLSKTLADMLMSTDFCDMATLTKSLNIDVNDVPLLLAVATTHTPQVATRYGISYR